MRRIAVALAVVALLVGASPALATTQPTNGIAADGRNPSGFGGGPHCHVIAVDNEQSNFDFIAVYPSHTGHANAGDDTFNADTNCDGDPGA
jgi:hypothetical protein